MTNDTRILYKEEATFLSEILNKIDETYNQMTDSQKQVSDYFSANLNSVAFKRLDELSANIGVSTTTIIRFARMLGYSGYTDMQQDVQASIRGQMSLPERLNTSGKNVNQDQLLLETFQNDIQNIKATIEAISHDDLTAVVEKIIHAPNVYVLGVRGSFSLAHYLSFRLAQIKKGVHLIPGTGMTYPEEITSINQDDLCICFLMPRYSKITANIIAQLKKKGVTIVLITEQNTPEISPYGDIILPCRTKGISYKKSLVAPFSVCNYILNSVALKDHDNAKEMLDRTEEILKDGFFLGLG